MEISTRVGPSPPDRKPLKFAHARKSYTESVRPTEPSMIALSDLDASAFAALDPRPGIVIRIASEGQP